MSHQGRNIRLFLEEGTPTGIISAEIINWTGEVLYFPRSKLTKLEKARYQKSGVYFLVNLEQNFVYVGESDDVMKRLIQHSTNEEKDWWETACVVTSKDANLTKAHTRYLEKALIELVQGNEFYSLKNGNQGYVQNLPRADASDMNYFLAQIRLILPVLGLRFLESGTVEAKKELESAKESMRSPIFEINKTKKGIYAQAQEIEGNFIVFKGSQFSKKLGPSADKTSYLKILRPTLIEKGIIDETSATFTQDYQFNSPSAAAAIIFGRSSNGRQEWKIKGSKQSYQDWQDSQLDVDI